MAPLKIKQCMEVDLSPVISEPIHIAETQAQDTVGDHTD